MSWDGKMYDKYRIEHTDGTPLRGKKYFVLRLDSDNPVEVARVDAAMRVYKSWPRNCDVGTAEEQDERFKNFCQSYYEPCNVDGECWKCPLFKTKTRCPIAWSQMPYEEEANNEQK